MSEVGAGSANGRTLRTLSLTHDKMAEFLLEEVRRNGNGSCLLAAVLDPHWQQAENEFSLFSWPSGEILAAHVLQHHDSIKGKRVVELGAGIALPSAAACRCGAASVEATDAAYAAPEAATLCRRNLDRNGASAVAIRSLKWSSDADGSAADGLEADILLGADVFYEPDGAPGSGRQYSPAAVGAAVPEITSSFSPLVHGAEFVSLLITVSSLLRRSPAAVFWTAYHERR